MEDGEHWVLNSEIPVCTDPNSISMETGSLVLSLVNFSFWLALGTLKLFTYTKPSRTESHIRILGSHILWRLGNYNCNYFMHLFSERCLTSAAYRSEI